MTVDVSNNNESYNKAVLPKFCFHRTKAPIVEEHPEDPYPIAPELEERMYLAGEPFMVTVSASGLARKNTFPFPFRLKNSFKTTVSASVLLKKQLRPIEIGLEQAPFVVFCLFCPHLNT